MRLIGVIGGMHKMELEEFKRQFLARRQEAQQERDELSKKAEDFLKEFKPLVEIEGLFVADLEAGKGEAAVKRLKDQGFDNVGMLDEKLRQVADDSDEIFARLQKLEDELNRQTVMCPRCRGLGYVETGRGWVEGDTGRLQIRKFDDCPLCKGKGKFAVDELLHC
jgi:hypothetical protein